MKKILIGMSGIVGTLAIVGVAYAAVAFGHVEATAQATTENNLLIFDDTTSTYLATTDLSGSAFANLTTVAKHKQLFFKNQSGSDTTALTGHQQGTLGGTLSGTDVQVAFEDGTSTTTPPDGDFHTLSDWTTANTNTGFNIPGVVIPANTSDHPVMMFVRLDPTTPSNGNTSYSVTGIDYDFGPVY